MAEYGALGGFSSGLTAGIGAANNMQQLRQQRQQLEQQAQQAQQEMELRRQTIEISRKELGMKGLEQISKKYEANLNMLVDAIDKAPDSGRANAILQSLEKNGVLKGLDDMAEISGSPANAQSILMSRVMSKQSEEEQLAMKGKEAGVVAEAQASATAKYREPRAPEMKNYITPTGERGIVNANDTKAIGMLPAGTQIFSAVAQSAAPGDFTRPSPKEGAETRETVTQTTGNIQRGADVLRSIDETPFASGARGTIAEMGSGILSQIPGLQKTAEQFSETVAGGSVAEVTEARTRMRMQVSGMLRAITGDESGRYSNQDRERAEEALRALDPAAGPEQIAAATKLAMITDLTARERAKSKLGASPYTDQAKLEGEAQKLIGMGFSEEEAIDAVVRIHKEMLDLQEQLTGPGNAQPR